MLKSRATFYYDNNTNNQAQTLTCGLLTKIERDPLDGTALSTQTAQYDGIGNAIAITNARNVPTTMSYDATGLRLKSQVSVGLSTSYFSYGVADASETVCSNISGGAGQYGQLGCIRDANGQYTAFSYDVFGRFKRVAKPGDTLDTPTEDYFYFDFETPFFTQHFVRKQSGNGSTYCDPTCHYEWGRWWTPYNTTTNPYPGADTNALATWERTFYDGLGRPIQSQRPTQDWTAGRTPITIADTRHDALGRASSQSVPYAGNEFTGNTWYQAPDAGQLQSTTQYVGLGDTVVITGSDGASPRQYFRSDLGAAGYTVTSGMLHSVVEPNGHVKHEVRDGLGRMIRVREWNGTGTNANLWTLYDSLRNVYL